MPLVELPTGFYMKFEAINPTTGAAVGGVTVGSISVAVESETPEPDVTIAPYAPLFVYATASNGGES